MFDTLFTDFLDCVCFFTDMFQQKSLIIEFRQKIEQNSVGKRGYSKLYDARKGAGSWAGRLLWLGTARTNTERRLGFSVYDFYLFPNVKLQYKDPPLMRKFISP